MQPGRAKRLVAAALVAAVAFVPLAPAVVLAHTIAQGAAVGDLPALDADAPVPTLGGESERASARLETAIVAENFSLVGANLLPPPVLPTRAPAVAAPLPPAPPRAPRLVQSFRPIAGDDQPPPPLRGPPASSRP
jgi:hypothetical protein